MRALARIRSQHLKWSTELKACDSHYLLALVPCTLDVEGALTGPPPRVFVQMRQVSLPASPRAPGTHQSSSISNAPAYALSLSRLPASPPALGLASTLYLAPTGR